MRTKLFYFLLIISLNLYSQQVDRYSIPSKPSENRGGGIISSLIDPINFFVQNMIGQCVNVSNVQISFTGDKTKNVSQIGIWDDSTNTLGIDYGLILSTGNVFDVIDSAGYFASSDVGGPGDPLLSSIIGFPTYDAVVIEFDFVPLADSIIPFEFIFASEEYPEWVGSSFNDIFGFFIEGPGYSGLTNIALIPSTNLPIAINSVNNIYNSAYYVDNTNGTFWAFDGYTTIFALNVPVIANQQYHFKLAIADASDAIFDSGILIKSGSFAGNIYVPVPSFTYTVNGNTVYFNNTTQHGMNYYWDFGDGVTSTEENPVHTYANQQIYQVYLKAYNHCYESEIYINVDLLGQNILSNQMSEFKVAEISNGIFEITGMKEQPDLYAITGVKVLPNVINKDNSIILNLTHLPKGLYILKSKDIVYKLSR